MATPITVTIPHKLGKAEARTRINAGLNHLTGQLAAVPLSRFHQAWDGDRLSFQAQGLGQTFTGRIDVNDADIRIEIDLPAFLANLADKIAGKLRRQGTLLLEKK